MIQKQLSNGTGMIDHKLSIHRSKLLRSQSSIFRWSMICVTVLLVSSCKSPGSIVLNGDFTASGRNAQEVLNEMRRPEVSIESLSGRARAQYSGPGSSERSSVIFASDRERTIMIFRNSLGIEGGKLLVETDSVTFYNRVDQFAQKISAGNHDALFSNGFYAVNLLSIINPEFETRRARRVYENDTSWRIVFDNQDIMVFDKQTGDLLQYELYIMNNFAFSTYLFGNYTEISGYRLPRNIQITTKDKRSNIFLTVQSYDVNPSVIDFAMDIPSHIRIERY